MHSTAVNFAMVAAIEYCLYNGEQAAMFQGMTDESQQQIYNRVYSTADLYVSPLLKDKNPKILNDPMLVRIPRIVFKFSCTKNLQILDPAPVVRSVKPELLANVSKDYRGGILVTENKATSPLQKGDIITHVAEKRVDGTDQMLFALMKAKNQRVPIRVLRNGRSVSVTAKTLKVVNVLHAINWGRLKDACEFKQGVEVPAICKHIAE
ncbi:MAG: PDZ domain-containing protein [Bdellovibrionota bacterium]